MAISLVQSELSHGATGNSITVTFPGATTAGNLLTLHGAMHFSAITGTITSITDTASNTWSFWNGTGVNQDPPFANVTDNSVSFCAWTPKAASATSVTLTCPAGILTFATVYAAEWSGAGSADTAAATGTDGIGAGLSASQALTLGGSGELVLLASNVSSSWGGGPSQATAFPGGFGTYSSYALNQSGSQTYTWTGAGSSSDDATTCVAAFLPPAAPGGMSQAVRSRLPEHQAQSQQIYQPGLIYVRS